MEDEWRKRGKWMNGKVGRYTEPQHEERDALEDTLSTAFLHTTYKNIITNIIPQIICTRGEVIDSVHVSVILKQLHYK